MMGNWIPIKEVNITNEINTIHCDTRDFHCLCLPEKIEIRDGRNNQIRRAFHKTEYLIDSNKIKDWLLDLEKMSGGEGEWRMLTFDNVNDENWLKYIRIYRVPGKDIFVICNRDNTPIIWKNCTEENIRKDLLNFD